MSAPAGCISLPKMAHNKYQGPSEESLKNSVKLDSGEKILGAYIYIQLIARDISPGRLTEMDMYPDE